MKNRSEKALFLIDGVHKPDNTIFAIKELSERYNVKPSALLWIGGREKMYSRESFSLEFRERLSLDVFFSPEENGELLPERGLADILFEKKDIKAVVQLAGAPQIDRSATLKYAGVSSTLGAVYYAGGTSFEKYIIDIKCDIPSMGLFATDKRVGKTAFGSYIGALACGIKGYDTKWKPAIFTHSRGAPQEPPMIEIYKPAAEKSAEKLTERELLSSRFKPENLIRLLEVGFHGASDVFEDALILSALLDRWEAVNDSSAPYISMVGCRRAGAGFFNEFAVSNVDKGIKKTLKSEANIIIHEGSGAEHPPVDIHGSIYLVPSDINPEILKTFPGFENAFLFIIANCQHASSSPEKVMEIKKALSMRSPGAETVMTRFHPEIVTECPEKLKGKKTAVYTTAPSSVLKLISGEIEKKYGVNVIHIFNNLDYDKEMKKSIDKVVKSGNIDIMFFEIKARGVEGAHYIKKKGYNIPHYYINNFPVAVDEKFRPLKDNSLLDRALLSALEKVKKK